MARFAKNRVIGLGTLFTSDYATALWVWVCGDRYQPWPSEL